MQKKKGDTLIEVALAIGIFSLVAIVVVSVVSASVTSAQSSLELTLTREELDAQAEALRFIHDSYVNDSQSADTSENAYSTLWEELKKHVMEANDNNLKKATYRPTYCSDLYDGSSGKFNSTNTNIQNTNPFIINIRTLGNLTNDGYASPDSIISVKSTDARSKFYEAPTYPRIVYGDTGTSTDQSLYDQTELGNTINIRRVEGIYIVGIKGNDNKIVSGAAVATDNKVSYYDFYIHSCWMPPGADRASTVSTVVRLYDPAAIMY